jgi:hypothetical protein
MSTGFIINLVKFFLPRSDTRACGKRLIRYCNLSQNWESYSIKVPNNNLNCHLTQNQTLLHSLTLLKHIYRRCDCTWLVNVICIPRVTCLRTLIKWPLLLLFLYIGGYPVSAPCDLSCVKILQKIIIWRFKGWNLNIWHETLRTF